ncbi:hypothetical protein G7046_g6365 [Stylonectria norvegica]|nr:hypothetical protein G7046_g6365 [Stylonectria norvegica]
MPFVSLEALLDTADVVDVAGNEPRFKPTDAPGRPTKFGLQLPKSSGVRDMTRHVRGESLDEIVNRYLNVRQLSPPLPLKEHINPRNIVSTNRKKGFYEAVSDLNGLVVTAAFELSVNGTLKTLGVDQSTIGAAFSGSPKERISWLCQKACEYEATLSGYVPRSVQMINHKFDWFKPDDLALAQNRLQAEVGDAAGDLKFEVAAMQVFPVGNESLELGGRADIMAVPSALDCKDGDGDKTIWEIKFISQLSSEHVIQACTYAYLLTPESEKVPRIMLYNVRDGEKREIIPLGGREGLRQVIEATLRLKHTTAGEMSHEDFVGMCAKTTQEVLDLGRSQE